MNEVDKFLNKFSSFTEPYEFYNGEVKLLYDKDNHIYLLVQGDELIPQPSVTQILHKVIDKSQILIPWGCKMMGEKLVRILPKSNYEGRTTTQRMYLETFQTFLNESKNAHREKLEDASLVGIIAHNWIEQHIKHLINPNLPCGDLPTDEQARNACNAALSWMKRHNIRWLLTERKIYSRIHKYAGTMDGLMLVDSCDDRKCCKTEFKDVLSIADWKTSNQLYIEYLFQLAAYQNAYCEETGTDIRDRWIIRLGKEDAEFQTWHLTYDEYDTDLFGFLNALRMYKSIESVEKRMHTQLEEMKEIAKQEKILVRQREANQVKLEKIETKLKKKLAQQEAFKLKCKNADKYKGVRKPTCNDNNPCEYCLNKYLETKKLAKQPTKSTPVYPIVTNLVIPTVE